MALLTVIWVMSLLALLAMAITADTREALHLAESLADQARARALAEAGITLAVSSLDSPRADPRWSLDGTPVTVQFGGGEIAVSVQDEGGKIDLNLAPEPLFDAMLAAAGAGAAERPALIDAIIDWRTPLEPPRMQGTTDGSYRSAGKSYLPAHAPFATIDELRLVLGIDRMLYDRLKPFATVYSQSARLNPATAPGALLQALPGADPERVRAFLATRGERREKGAAPLPPLGAANRYLAQIPAPAYSIRAEARTERGGRFTREVTILRTPDEPAPFRIVAWRQGGEAALDREALLRERSSR